MGRLAAVVLLVAAVLVGPAGAKNISISITSTVTVSDGVLVSDVTITNSGDEAAESVTPVLGFRGKQSRGEVRPSLGPSQSMKATLSVPAGDLKPGRWPYRLAVDYTDANQYPFQALHTALVTVGSPPPAKLRITEVKGGPLTGSSTLAIRVKNLEGVERRATISVAAPEGIEVTTPPRETTVPAWGETAVDHALVNRTALAGSRYPVFVAAEYDDGDVHQTAVGQGMVDIKSQQSFFETWRTTLWIGAGIFVAAWLGVLLWRVAAPRQRRAETRP